MAFSNEVVLDGNKKFKENEVRVSKIYNLWASNSLYGDFSLHALSEESASILVETSNHPELLGWVPVITINLNPNEVYFDRLDLKPCKFIRFTTTNGSAENKITAVACFV